MILFYFGILFFLFLIGLPVAYSMGIGSIFLMANFAGSINYGIVFQRLVYGVNSFVLVAIPLFLFAGSLMNTGGITRRIFKFAQVLVGHLKGGLGHVNIVASIIFAGMTGIATADAAGLGAVEIKAMVDEGYDKEFAVAITGASSTIGPIIPPSVPLIVYGILASVSIGRLLVAGIIPGLIMGFSLMIMVSIIASKRNYPHGNKPDFNKFFKAFKISFFPMITPIIIIGGILSGIFTPTEAAAIACLYAFTLNCFLYHEINFKELWKVIRQIARDASIITFVISCATLYAYVLIQSRIPIILMEKMITISNNPLVIIFVLNAALLIVGCFMDTIAALNILVPILIPLLLKVGIDPLHFGIVMVLNLMIGLLTPPYGLILFILNKISGVPLEKIIYAVLPFLIPLIATLLLIVIFPQLVTFLPDLLF